MVSTLPENKEATQTQDQTQTQTQTVDNDATSANFIGRVMSYPTVNSIIDTAKGYYSYAKESNDLIKKGCESVEQGIDSSMKYVVMPVLENEMVKKIETPLDKLACQQLDKLEQLQETYKPTYDSLKTKANDLAATGINAVQPVDQYLKTSMLAAPLNAAVNITEAIVDRYLPEKKESSEKTETPKSCENTTEVKEEVTPGPIFKSGAIAMKLQKEAMSKLSNLSLRDASTIDYKYIVNLIDYAANNLDHKYHESTQKVQSTIQEGKDYVASLEIKENASIKANEALTALLNAIELISSRLPENVNQTTSKVYQNIKDIPIVIESANSEFYQTLSAKSSEKLKELGTKISQTLELSGSLPITLLQNTQETLFSIYTSFFPAKDYTETQTQTQTSSQ